MILTNKVELFKLKYKSKEVIALKYLFEKLNLILRLP